MRNRKRASLSLSVNAIVVLILAITMLGLGLGFMRGMFRKAEGNIETVFDSNQLERPPTTDNPLTITPPSLNIKQSESDAKTVLAFMNVLSQDMYCRLVLPQAVQTEGPQWVSSTSPSNTNPPTLLANTQCTPMSKDQINTWTVPIIPKDAGVGTHLGTMLIECFVHPSCGGSPDNVFTRDITVTVRP